MTMNIKLNLNLKLVSLDISNRNKSFIALESDNIQTINLNDLHDITHFLTLNNDIWLWPGD